MYVKLTFPTVWHKQCSEGYISLPSCICVSVHMVLIATSLSAFPPCATWVFFAAELPELPRCFYCQLLLTFAGPEIGFAVSPGPEARNRSTAAPCEVSSPSSGVRWRVLRAGRWRRRLWKCLFFFFRAARRIDSPVPLVLFLSWIQTQKPECFQSCHICTLGKEQLLTSVT